MLLYPGRPHRVLLGFKPPFSLILLNPEGNRGGARKGIKFGIERLIINSVRELGFGGTRLQLGWWIRPGPRMNHTVDKSTLRQAHFHTNKISGVLYFSELVKVRPLKQCLLHRMRCPKLSGYHLHSSAVPPCKHALNARLLNE